MQRNRFRLWLHTRPRLGSLQRSSDFLAGFKGLLKVREGEEGEGRREEGKGGREGQGQERKKSKKKEREKGGRGGKREGNGRKKEKSFCINFP